MDSTTHSRQEIVVLRLSLSLALIEGVFVFWTYVTAPSETDSIVFLQYSALRLILLLFVLLCLLVLTFLLVVSVRPNWGVAKIIGRLLDRTEPFWILLTLTGCAYFLLFTSDQILPQATPYRERLYPMLIWFGLIALQFTIGLITLRVFDSGVVRVYRESLRPSVIAIIMLVFLVAFIALTNIGLVPDAIYWQGPGVPLLFVQVLVATIIALTFSPLAYRFGSKVDFAASIVLWGLAVFLWWGQPARVSYNTLEPAPPNFQEYPFGDAILYDTVAHEFLAGAALPNDFWVKPLYSFFLAALHFFARENYALLVFLQVVILAIVPAFVYLLVSLIANRTAGVLAGLLVILREQNSIALSNVIQVAHLKLLLSDMFSMGLVVLLVWLMFLWFEKPEGRRDSPLLIGGAIGLLVLTRGHPVLLFPIIFFVVFLFPSVGLRQRLQRAALFVVGITLVLVPWLWRIYETTGRFALQSPVSPYSANMAGLYSLTPRLANPELFTTDVSSQTLEQSDSQNKQVMRFILQHPDEVTRFVSAHFFHNVIHSYIYLPQSFRIETLRSYVTSESFWGNWQGEFSLQNWIFLFINMGLIALGLGTVWRKHKLLALVPLLVGIGYNASVSVGRISGWRFILPADWITLVYFSVGLVQFSYILKFIVTRSAYDVSISKEVPTTRDASTRWISAFGFAVLFLFIGTAVTYGNRIFSNRYPILSVEALAGQYLSVTESLGRPFTENELKRFLQNYDQAVLIYGQAIYPYYLKANSGPINHAWPAYKPRPYNRVVFYITGPESMNVILPISSHNFDFPDGADVIVVGCSNDHGDVEAASILIAGVPPTLFVREPMPEFACPLAESP